MGVLFLIQFIDSKPNKKKALAEGHPYILIRADGGYH